MNPLFPVAVEPVFLAPAGQGASRITGTPPDATSVLVSSSVPVMVKIGQDPETPFNADINVQFKHNPANGDTFVIGATPMFTYTFLDVPAGILPVQRGPTLSATLENLRDALNTTDYRASPVTDNSMLVQAFGAYAGPIGDTHKVLGREYLVFPAKDTEGFFNGGTGTLVHPAHPLEFQVSEGDQVYLWSQDQGLAGLVTLTWLPPNN